MTTNTITAPAGRLISILTAAVLVGAGTGCKPYESPQYVEIDTSDAGFLIPLESDAGQQARYESVDYLRQRKVLAKRVRIVRRWSQEGRFSWMGRWIPAERLVKVNRSPVTREWTSQGSLDPSGQRHPQHDDRAIWIESADSVGFTMGFTCTAFIPEEEAARFLYWYPSGSLAEIMDKEVRGRVQQAAAEVAAKYDLDVLRSKKQEISDAVRRDLTNYFALRGIVIATVGMFGGMSYENPAIQKSIDETFMAQQLKVVAEAKFQAQKSENDRIELEALAHAERLRREAQGLADSRRIAAQAESEGIREINRATADVPGNPLFLQIKQMELEKARIERWDGRLPQWVFGSGTNVGTAPQVWVNALAGDRR